MTVSMNEAERKFLKDELGEDLSLMGLRNLKAKSGDLGLVSGELKLMRAATGKNLSVNSMKRIYYGE